MSSPSSRALHPAVLPPGTVIGDWRLVTWAGCGVYGAVYRAVSSRDEHSSPVALKLALHPDNPRFAREAELLSRCHHPSIPRLLGQGSWLSPIGTHHPFLLMEWIDGVPLYDQVKLHLADPPQVRRWLLQLAQALAVIHAQGAVHRDLKGENVLVSRSDGRAMLMDFGTGLYPGAAPLTPAMTFPGTLIYRPPEALLFEIQHYRDPTALYRPSPADDLYALGVTACKLLTGKYPEPDTPSRDEQGIVHLDGVLLPRFFVSNPHVDPALRSVTLRLLSVRPEQRGTAAQVAEELESTLKPFRPDTSRGSRGPVKRYSWRRWALVAAGLALLMGALWATSETILNESPVAQAEPPEADAADAGTAGLGDSATSSMMEDGPSAPTQENLSDDPLPEPIPGQARPDEKGRCPRKGLVSLNGGCWAETSIDREGCAELGGQMFRRSCYMPFVPRGRERPPTSDPMKTPQ